MACKATCPWQIPEFESQLVRIMRSIVLLALLFTSTAVQAQIPKVVSLGDVPSRYERMGLRVTTFGDKVALFGGYEYPDKQCLTDVGFLDGNGRERPSGIQLKLGRNHFGAIPLDRRRTLVFGGYGKGDLTLDEVEAVDLSTGKVEQWPSLPNPVELFSSVRFGNKVAVIGGLRNQDMTRTWDSVQVLDLKTHLSKLNSGVLKTSRFGADAVWVPSGRKVVIAGGKHVTQVPDGVGKTKASYQALSSIEIWDPATGRVSDGGHMVFRRDRPRLVALQNGKVLILGGRSDNETLKSIELYDPATHLSKVVGSLGARRMALALLPFEDGILISGGWTDEPDKACDIEYLDLRTYKVVTVGRSEVCRAEHAMAWVRPEVFALIGGKDAFKGRDPERYRFASTELFKVIP